MTSVNNAYLSYDTDPFAIRDSTIKSRSLRLLLFVTASGPMSARSDQTSQSQSSKSSNVANVQELEKSCPESTMKGDFLSSMITAKITTTVKSIFLCVTVGLTLCTSITFADPPKASTPVEDSWPNLGRYRNANASLALAPQGENRVIFYGDSITDSWARDKSFFPGLPYIGRGISGQTTMQMLVRFRADVIDLQPKAVVILAGTNDIAANQGLTSLKLIEDNLQSMADLALANHIQPILSSILPASDYRWRKGMNPGPKIVEVNKWMEDYCQKNHLVFLNYYPALVGNDLGMRPELTLDGVHPNPAGYAIMAPLAQAAVRQAVP